MGLEKVKQTQKLHSHILQNILVKMNGAVTTVAQLPEGLRFPVDTLDELIETDKKIMDDLEIQKVLVSIHVGPY